MANDNNKDIEIRVKVDTSDAKKELKDFEKSSDKMAKKVVKDTNDMNKAQEQLEKELKKVNTSMKDAFKNVNINGLTKAMKNVQNTVSKTLSNVQKQFQKALNVKANIDINTNTTTSKSDGADNNYQGKSVLGSTLTGGAMGASIAKEMAQIRDAILQTTKESGTSFNTLSNDMKTKIVDAVTISKKAIEEMEAEFNQLKVEGLEFDPKDALIGEIDNITEDIKYYEEVINELQYEINDCMQDIEDGIEYSNSSPQEVIEDLKEQQEEYRKTQEALLQYQNQLKMFMTIGGMDGLTDDIEQLAKAFSEVKSKANLELLVEKLKEFRQVLANAGVDVTVFDKAISECESSMQKTGQITKGTVEAVSRITTEVRTFKKASDEVVDSMNKVERNAKELADANLLAKPFIQAKQAIPGMARLYDNITSSLKRLVAGYKSAAKGGEKLAKSNKNLSTSFKSLMSSLAPFLGIAAIFSSIGNAIRNAMESVETNNMFDVVFGSSAQDMDAWVSEMNKTLGLGIVDTKQYTATIMQMGKAMGLNSQQAMEMSKSMALLAGDISSFYNVDLSQAQQDLQSALSGSNETLQKYGVILREDTIKQTAYQNGIAAMGAELTSAQRAMTLTMMVEQQLGAANGDLARSINSPANQARILRANLHDLSVALGNCFMPILTVVLPILNRFVAALASTINTIATFVQKLFSLFGISTGGSSSGGILGNVADSAGDIGTSLGDGLSDAAGGAGSVADDLKGAAKSAKEIVKSLMGVDEINNLSADKNDSGSGGSGSGGSGSGGSGGGAGGGLFDGVADSAQEAGDKSESIFGEIEQWIKDLANAMKEVWDTLKNGWNSVSGYITQSVANLKQAFSNLGTAIKNFLIGAWNNGGEELVYNFGRLAGAIVGCAIDITGQVVQAFANLFNYLNPETNSITKGFIRALNRMLVASQDFALSLGKWFSIFMSSGGQAFLNVLGDIVLLIGTILANVLADGITLVTNFFNSWAGHAVIKTVAITLNVLAGVVKAALIVIDKCRYAIYALILMFGAFKLSKIINDFNTFNLSMIKSKDTVLTFGQKLAFAQVQFAGFKTAMVNTLSSFKTFIVNGLKSAIKFTIDLGKGVVNLVIQFKNLAIQLASNAIKGIANTIGHPIQTVKTLASTIATCTVNMIKFGASMLTNAVKGLVGLATQCYAGVASLLGLSVAEGTATAGAVALQIALSALGIGLIVGAIVGLIAVIKNWSTITAKISDLWKKFMNFLGEKCPWLKGIFEALGNVFSWIGEKVGWLWDKVKGFFGWSGNNNPTEMAEDTDLAMEGLGDTVEETSDRFGSACSAINQSLASLEIDSTRLALSLDEAEQTFNEKFDRMSSNAKDYLQAIADGNQDSLDQMGVDTEAALEELRYTWEKSSEEEKAIMYAKYGEINGITDSWMNYTGLSYDQMVLRHASYIENVNKNEKLSVQEKDRLINEANNNFRNSLDTQLADLKKQLAEVDKLEGISNSDRIAMKQELKDQIASIEEGMTKNSTDSIKTVEDATKASTEVQKDAYSTVGEAQAGSLQEVSTNLEDTKAELDAFSKHSETIAEEIPTHWKEIGKTISTEFTKAKDDVIKAFNSMNTAVKTQVATLKTNLSSAFKGITTDAKLSTTNMATAVKNAFQSMSNAVKQQLNALTVSVKNSFQSMSTNIKSQLNSLSSSIKTSFNNIANTINNAFNNISSRLVSTLNTMKSQVSSAMNSLKSTFSSSLDSIKSTTQTKIQQICTTMVNKVNQSKTSISNAFNNIGTGIGNSLNNLNNQVKNKMNSVVASVQDGVRRMKNATNFNFPTPYMKMPHIKVTGNWDFEKKKVPSFSVNWWSSGAIFNKRTILGNMGVGDAQNGFGNNPEAVLPLDALWSEMDKQFAKQTAILANSKQPINAELTVNLDGKKIAKNTYKNLQEMQRLGQIQY